MTNQSERDKDSVYVPIPEAQYSKDSAASGYYYLPFIKKLFNNQLSPDSIIERIGNPRSIGYDTVVNHISYDFDSFWENYIDYDKIDKEFFVLAYYRWPYNDSLTLMLMYDATTSPETVINGFLVNGNRYMIE